MKRMVSRCVAIAASAAAVVAGEAAGQAPPAPPAPAEAAPPAAAPAPSAGAAAAPALEELAWLRGCWAGKVERWDFIEQWTQPHGDMMLGTSHTIVKGDKKAATARTQDFTYLRLEQRADGVYYVAIPSGKKESAFKLASIADDRGKTAYTFTSQSPAQFPQKIVYLRGAEGWLYAQVTGKVDEQPREVTYPMRHVDCATGKIEPN